MQFLCLRSNNCSLNCLISVLEHLRKLLLRHACVHTCMAICDVTLLATGHHWTETLAAECFRESSLSRRYRQHQELPQHESISCLQETKVSDVCVCTPCICFYVYTMLCCVLCQLLYVCYAMLCCVLCHDILQRFLLLHSARVGDTSRGHKLAVSFGTGEQDQVQ